MDRGASAAVSQTQIASRHALRWQWLAVALLAILALPMPVAAQTGIAGRPIAVCIAPRSADLAPRTLFANPARFDCRVDQSTLGSGDFDVLSAPLPPRTGIDQSVSIRMASLWQQRATLYALYADGAIARIAIDGHRATRDLQLGAVVEQPLPIRTVPLVRLLWRIEASGNMHGILRGTTIASPADSARSNLTMAGVYAGFAGLCVALLIYNLALWAALRHPFQLAYCTMVATLLIYAISSSGALAWIVPGIANNVRLRINYLSLALAAAAAISFSRSFFEASVFAGWLGRMSTVVSWTLGLSAMAFACFAPWQPRLFDRLYAASFVMVMALVLPVLYRAWRQRSNYLWMFALGWATPIALASLRIANNFNLVPWSFWLDNSTILAMTAEAVLSSLAIAYRIHLLSRERDEAREQEVAARLLAATDPLTGLLNRRAFLEQAIGRDGDQMLLLADIDHFKRVNETIGHDGGDEVLRVFARALKRAVPADALVARVGGEEFAIIAPVEAALSAALVLESLRAERMPFDLSVTASIGTCAGPLQRDVDWKMLYRRADRALFEAKAAGRDRSRDAGQFNLAA